MRIQGLGEIWQQQWLCQMNFYTGKQEGGATEVGLGAKVVTRLTRDLVGRNHSVYMDNFFSSIDLFQNLLTDKIYATGTLYSNRELSSWPNHCSEERTTIQGKWWMSAETKCGSDCMATYETCCNSVYTAWPNCRNLCKEKGDGSIIDVRCLQAIVDYNCHMCGVDLGGHYRDYYQVQMQSCKFHNTYFGFCLRFVSWTLSSFIIIHLTLDAILPWVSRRTSTAAYWKLLQ